ncbi:hypothetical protein COCC4DRAFT_48563 [Bipolaris maydis ATCC 48331]|uniref:Uncharacterized protein n=2 Tax=Cochliobolus heterostrophus TaxID=5016 RepID=M2U6Z1_COCH5|nr:uncharacterized protein COCC4DRAFT_48563 [Bipolaris maydis ATCC 48331]EMD94269.1 hypothetical protein COCHEDRAFT_1170135 [Bipolaris maydis C5]KAJ5026557.1 hypothetical protein J3E73DRAFT_381444 [Bipolaris maydis]ENI07433.1 hypothetical protein COCC4DRAFT_48563 [Bipolaris maydis ATCC 48331]KAJ5059717.1 hypothetical protein J3E74DRAFT_419173 [Bipolaris maydis]KAJ6209711.1 hypothetical protein PSV09DRAFT_1170135 [Bipolaris maydis]
MASRFHLLEDNNAANMLLDRAIDPADMNPTQFSILSVLKTAMPSGTSIPMPTGTSEPDWYKNLPDDVKSLLPQFYPATTTASVERTSTSSEVVSQASSTPTSTPVLTSSLVSEEASSSSAFVSAAAVTSASVQVSSSSLPSTSTPTIPLFSSTVSTFPSASSNSSTTVTTTSASPTPSALFSAGLRNTVHTGLLAAVAYVSVALGFCLFA